ncbi:hypothetical protein LTR17_008064 [Elasticomyces elasticus]|nr:hypothetical protein LTR17_008064 [Elasticomyces elasticus]
MDYLPTSEFCSTEDYIILPGDLREYKVDGEVRQHYWDEHHRNAVAWAAFEAEIKQRQVLALDDAELSVEKGQGTLQLYQGWCGAKCGIRPKWKEDRLSEEEEMTFAAEAEKEERAALRMSVRYGAEALAEVAHAELDQVVSGCSCE